ncbi:calmodulin-dependent protein kinase [Gigaspora margarita]|uniref:Calmodulin-dependent protein kinase n=1 Tax=Gigaspora margarita TaxID=4874 RepID=A0A8H3X0C1_GIGMA|nr:calmodulin-dependent protein kinase [Gigaspora margarita]
MNDSYRIFSVRLCYENRVGVEKNEHKTLIYYQKFAEMGNVNGIHDAGYCYLYGVGVKKDEYKVFFYFQKSAEMGDTMETNSVEYCYQLGIGVEIENICHSCLNQINKGS